jgi:hypothetical protein
VRRRAGRYAVAVVLVALVAAPCAEARLVATKGFFPGAGRIVIAHDDGSHVRRLAGGDEAWISPDGKRVAITDADPGQQGTHPRLKVYRSSGGPPLFVIRTGIFPFAWSPDSTKLVATESHGTTDRMIVVDAATGARTPLATGISGSATFSPDSKEVAFVVFGPGVTVGGTLQVRDLATGAVRTLRKHASQPVWGPNAIAFATVAHNDYRFQNLATIQPDGSGFRQLTNRPAAHTSGFSPIDWSDDGRRLLAGYYAQTTPLAYDVDPVHGGARLIARRVDPQALSRDGRVVIGQTGNPYCCTDDPINVVRVPWKGGQPHILIRKAFRASSND